MPALPALPRVLSSPLMGFGRAHQKVPAAQTAPPSPTGGRAGTADSQTSALRNAEYPKAVPKLWAGIS